MVVYAYGRGMLNVVYIVIRFWYKLYGDVLEIYIWRRLCTISKHDAHIGDRKVAKRRNFDNVWGIYGRGIGLI